MSLYNVAPTLIRSHLPSAEGGELFQKVMMEEENFDEQEVQRLMRQILEAVLFLHDRDIVHLDIKVRILEILNELLIIYSF